MAVPGTYEGEDWEAAKEEIEKLMDAFDLPAGYSWSWNDRIVEQEGENAEMGVNFLLALVLVYLVMASLFESLAQPLRDPVLDPVRAAREPPGCSASPARRST